MVNFTLNIPAAPGENAGEQQGGQEPPQNGAQAPAQAQEPAGAPPVPSAETIAQASVYTPAQGNVLIAYQGHDMSIRIPYAASEDSYNNFDEDEDEWYDPEAHSFQVPHLLGEEFVRVMVTNWIRPGGGDINDINFVSPKGRRKVKVKTAAGGQQEVTAYLFENLPGGLWGMNFEPGKVSEVPWAHGGDRIMKIATQTQTFTMLKECDRAQLCEQPKVPAYMYKGPPVG